MYNTKNQLSEKIQNRLVQAHKLHQTVIWRWGNIWQQRIVCMICGNMEWNCSPAKSPAKRWHRFKAVHFEWKIRWYQTMKYICEGNFLSGFSSLKCYCPYTLVIYLLFLWWWTVESFCAWILMLFFFFQLYQCVYVKDSCLPNNLILCITIILK